MRNPDLNVEFFPLGHCYFARAIFVESFERILQVGISDVRLQKERLSV